MDENEIIGFEALWDSSGKCKRGVMWKDSVAHFMLNRAEQVLKLHQELNDGTYVERPHKTFKVMCPKERDIVSIAFRDRVYQRSLNDNAIYPAISKSLIYDNCACQKGKGTDFARNRFKCHLQRAFRENRNVFVLKLDVRHYYPTMSHELAKSVFKKHLDPNVYDRAEVILDSYEGDVGYNPGSQMIQIAGISVLNDIDHYVKETLRVKHYIRYMDDMLLVSGDKAFLMDCKAKIEKQLNAIGFELHSEKSKLYDAANGVLFLGFIFRITQTGGLVLTVDPKRVKAYRKKLFRLVELAKRGKITKAKVDECYASWKAHAEHGNSYKLLLRMDKYYEELWKKK